MGHRPHPRPPVRHERSDAATVTLDQQDATKISLTLACSADSKFYDQPLTLLTTLPDGWTTCSIDQGQRHVEAPCEHAGTVHSMRCREKNRS